MTIKQPMQPDELRMKSDDFDRIMRGALVAAAPPSEPKVKPKKQPTASTAKKTTKR